jgi:hypothetical protein
MKGCFVMLARLVAISLWAAVVAEPVLAAPGNSGGNPRRVPEIDLFTGTAAIMALVLLALVLWERHRRAANH